MYKRKLNTANDEKALVAIEDKINKFIGVQDRHIEEMKHILMRLEVKIEAYEDKLTSLNKEIKTVKQKLN